MTLRPFLDVLTAQAGDVVGDPSNQRIVGAIVVALLVLGVVVVGVTVWFWRSTRPEPAALGPLEEMSRRRFRRLPDHTRKERLDAVRGISTDAVTSDVAVTSTESAGTRDDTRPIDPLLAPPPPVP